MLTSISAFCQTSYPKMIIEGTDTLVVLTTGQVIKINRTINKARFLEVENNILAEQSLVMDSIVAYYKNIVLSQDSIILFKEEKYEAAEKFVESLKEDIKREKKNSNKKAIRVGVISALVGAVIGTVILK